MTSTTEHYRKTQTAKCRTCQEVKPWQDFDISKSRRPFGLSSNCSLCEKERKRLLAAKWRVNNKEEHKKRHRAENLKKKFGISVEEYDLMSETQSHKCLICEEPENNIHHSTGKAQRLAVDHCHKTGQVRGLLCARCNKGLGFFRDNPQLLLSAVKYLKK